MVEFKRNFYDFIVGVRDKKITVPHYMAMFLRPYAFDEARKKQ